MSCKNHPDRVVHARELCSSCYTMWYRQTHEKSRIWHRETTKRWRKNNRQKRKYLELKYHYGLTKDQFDSMLLDQNNRCAICERNWSKRGPCVDHNHTTGKVRGLLCDDCNKKVGHYEKLITYPKFHTYLT